MKGRTRQDRKKVQTSVPKPGLLNMEESLFGTLNRTH